MPERSPKICRGLLEIRMKILFDKVHCIKFVSVYVFCVLFSIHLQYKDTYVCVYISRTLFICALILICSYSLAFVTIINTFVLFSFFLLDVYIIFKANLFIFCPSVNSLANLILA